MADEILDEIWRVREELIKKHGGWDNYFKYIQSLDRARRARKRAAKARKRKTASKGRSRSSK